MKPDWTMNADGAANSSPAFERTLETVAEILNRHMLCDDVRATARIIVARLAHGHGLAPAQETP